MSRGLGPLRYSDNEEEIFLGHSVARHKNVSDATARMIDEEWIRARALYGFYPAASLGDDIVLLDDAGALSGHRFHFLRQQRRKRSDEAPMFCLADFVVRILGTWHFHGFGLRPNVDIAKVKNSRDHFINANERYGWTEMVNGRWWTLVTYMFLHSPNMVSHIIFNMLGLKLFGTPVEKHIGSHEFLCLYFVCGIIAGLFAAVMSINSQVAIIGASGALFSVMVIYATLYPDAVIYAWFFPLRARTAVLLFAGIAIFSTMYRLAPSVSHLTHIGGIVAGFLYCWLRIGKNPFDVFFRRR